LNFELNRSMPTKTKPAKTVAKLANAKSKTQNPKLPNPKSDNPKSKIQNLKSANLKSYTSPARLQKIFAGLDALFPNPECALLHDNPFQLLVATILSAQCTDERVNKVTPGLFRKWPTPQDYVGLPQQELEHEIHSAGFFRNKAKNIIGAATRIVNVFGGQVPRTMEELLSLPGVARKTANVVLGTAYGIALGAVVDTHVFRITHRLKLSEGKTPEKVEGDLMRYIPQTRWVAFSHQLILFGRKICFARKPLCAECPLASICDAPDKTI
jgi:endonuclease-3